MSLTLTDQVVERTMSRIPMITWVRRSSVIKVKAALMTKREKHFIVIVSIAGILIMLFGGKIPYFDGAELLYLSFFVLPLGIYIATDPERRKVE